METVCKNSCSSASPPPRLICIPLCHHPAPRILAGLTPPPPHPCLSFHSKSICMLSPKSTFYCPLTFFRVAIPALPVHTVLHPIQHSSTTCCPKFSSQYWTGDSRLIFLNRCCLCKGILHCMKNIITTFFSFIINFLPLTIPSWNLLWSTFCILILTLSFYLICFLQP